MHVRMHAQTKRGAMCRIVWKPAGRFSVTWNDFLFHQCCPSFFQRVYHGSEREREGSDEKGKDIMGFPVTWSPTNEDILIKVEVWRESKYKSYFLFRSFYVSVRVLSIEIERYVEIEKWIGKTTETEGYRSDSGILSFTMRPTVSS